MKPIPTYKLFGVFVMSLTAYMALIVPNNVEAFPKNSESSLTVAVSLNRRTTELQISGKALLPDSAKVKVDLLSGTKVFLSSECAVDNSMFKTTLRTRKFLLAGRYQARLSLAKQQPNYLQAAALKLTPRTVPFALGASAEQQQARLRLVTWLTTAHQTLGRASRNLMNQGHWHLELLKQNEKNAAVSTEIRGHFARQFGRNSNFDSALNVAQQDLLLYQRRLLVDPFAQTSEQLLAWTKQLRVEVQSWQKQLGQSGKNSAAPAMKKIQSLEAQARQQLTKAAPISWKVSPLASVESGSTNNGIYQSQSLAYKIGVPENWIAKPFSQLSFNYSSRLRATIDPKDQKGISISVSLQELSPGQALIDKVSTEAWENRQSYKRLELKKLETKTETVRHHYSAELPLAKKSLAVKVLEHHLKYSDDFVLVVAATAPADKFENYAKTFEEVLTSVQLTHPK